MNQTTRDWLEHNRIFQLQAMDRMDRNSLPSTTGSQLEEDKRVTPEGAKWEPTHSPP